MKAVTSYVAAIFIAVAALSLNGCALLNLKQHKPDFCSTAPVLYTDLSKPTNERTYKLPNGQDCGAQKRGGYVLL